MKDQVKKEVKVLSRLRSKIGFSKLLDEGRTPEGHHFIVMERLGENLKQVLLKTKKRKFSLKSVV